MAQLIKIFVILLCSSVHAGTMRHAAQRAYYSDLQAIILDLKPEERQEKLNKKKNDKSILEILASNADSQEKRFFMTWLKEQLEPEASKIAHAPLELESSQRAYTRTQEGKIQRNPDIREGLELIASEINKAGINKDFLLPDPKQLSAIMNFAALKLTLENKITDRFDLCNTKESCLEVVSCKHSNGYVGSFIIDDKTTLGEGAQGCIKLAQNLQCSRLDKCIIAVKKCNIADITRRRDSDNESKILAHLNRFHGGVVIGNNYYLFMELYRAISLPQLPTDLAPEIKNSITMQVLASVRSLHLSSSPSYPNGILHRDIKPGNFLVEIKNSWVHVVLIDFGSSRDRVDISDETICVFGTPAYVAPECFKQRIHNEKTDYYSAGLVMSLGLIYDGYNRYENFQNKLKPKFEVPLVEDIFKACPDVSFIWSEWEALEINDPWQHRIKKFALRLIQPKPEHRPEAHEIDELIVHMTVIENQFRERGGYTKAALKRSKKFLFLIDLPPKTPDDSPRSSPGSSSRSLTRSGKSGSGSLSASGSPSASPKTRAADSSSGKSSKKTTPRKFVSDSQRPNQII